MSIIIQNITDTSQNPEPTGTHKYALRINRKLIAEFFHTREEGLSVCLKKAAQAAALAEQRGLREHFEELQRVRKELLDAPEQWQLPL